MIFHLNHDLMLASSVRAAAAANGHAIQFSRRLDDLAEAIRAGGVTKVLVDLQTPGLDLEDLQAVVASAGEVPVILYAQHVLEPLLEFAAQLPGVTVLTRGQFSRAVRELLA